MKNLDYFFPDFLTLNGQFSIGKSSLTINTYIATVYITFYRKTGGNFYGKDLFIMCIYASPSSGEAYI